MTTPLRRALVVLSAWALVDAVIAALVLLAVGLELWLALVVGLVVGVLVAAAVYLLADRIVVRLTRAEPADPQRHRRVLNVLAGLCAANGVSEPVLMVVPDAAPNALVVGRGRSGSTLVVTEGLLGILRRIELEGIVAHLLARVRADLVGAETLAAVVIGVPLAPLPAWRTRALEWVVGDNHAIAYDIEGVRMTRYPPGLSDALARLAQVEVKVRFAPRAAQHLWIDEPAEGTTHALHRPLTERIEVLQEL